MRFAANRELGGSNRGFPGPCAWRRTHRMPAQRTHRLGSWASPQAAARGLLWHAWTPDSLAHGPAETPEAGAVSARKCEVLAMDGEPEAQTG